MEISRKRQDKEKETIALLQLEYEYKETKQIETAVKCYEKALEIAREDKEDETIAYLQLEQACCEKDQIRIGNYTVREVLMKNRTRVWRNVYNTASA